MKRECLGSLTALLAGAGLGLAQPAPAPPVLATPAPHARPAGALPTELPGLPDSTAPGRSNPGLFPFPGTGLYQTPSGPVCELPPYYEPAAPGTRKKGKRGAGDEPRCHVWASGEPLLWWVRPGAVPPLVTTGAAGTGLLYGDEDLDYGMLVGGRVAAGMTNAGGNLGLEGSGLLLGRGTTHFAAASGPDGSPPLGRPFTNALFHVPQAERVAGPGALAGGVAVASSSQLWGAEANLVGSAYGNERVGIDLLGGFRYLNLEEDLGITQAGTPLGAGAAGFGGTFEAPGVGFGVADSFRTRNQFYGGQLGSQVEVRWGRLYTNLLGKVAFGSVHQVVDVRGDSTLYAPGGLVVLPGGLLAVASNAGRQTHDEFAVLPEVNVNVGYQLRPGVRLYAGYTFLYLNDVARPGDQVNATVNPAQVPTSLLYGFPGGPAQPAPALNRSDFWAQGINFGLALRY